MKRFAFTMIELVFAIVVIGILSAVFIPRMDRDSLSEAAIQLASHIRYTQHLAMVDDKYMPNPDMSSQANSASRIQEARYWYLGRWQLRFSTANSSQSYMVMSDSTISNYDGNPNASVNFSYSEVARDPLDNNKYLIGTTFSSFDNDSDEHINDNLDLKDKYGIEAISISGGASGSTARRIIFDHLGRPYRGDTKLSNASVISSSTDKLAQTNITIKLCKESCSSPIGSKNNDNERLITIAPETGYVSITL
ncbi:MAG: type II secretion system protein [Campylobacterota bacterium]|nr:type II secretion system protein [Campylobacterota bacterium]